MKLNKIADLLKVYRELKKLSSVIHGSVLLKWYDFTAILKKCMYTILKLESKHSLKKKKKLKRPLSNLYKFTKTISGD